MQLSRHVQTWACPNSLCHHPHVQGSHLQRAQCTLATNPRRAAHHCSSSKADPLPCYIGCSRAAPCTHRGEGMGYAADDDLYRRLPHGAGQCSVRRWFRVAFPPIMLSYADRLLLPAAAVTPVATAERPSLSHTAAEAAVNRRQVPQPTTRATDSVWASRPNIAGLSSNALHTMQVAGTRRRYTQYV